MDNPITSVEGPSDAAAPDGLVLATRGAAPVALAVLAVIAVVAALYLARAFFVPLLIGILASYSLRPAVEWLASWHIPRPLGAALVLAAVVAGSSWAVFSLGDDAAAVIETLPEAARRMRGHVSVARAGGPSALNKIQEAASELEGAATDATGDGKPAKAKRPGPAGREAEPSAWLRDYMLAQSALLFTVAAQAPIVLLLAYFLLASGEHFRRKLVRLAGPTLSRKKDAVRILDEIDVQVQRYLLATVGANVLVGLVTWLAFEALGMEHAGVWGVAAGILHFIPYLGPVLFAIASGVAGFMQVGTVLGAFAVAGASLLVAAAVGQLIMTWLQSRLAHVNAAVLFIALLFFGWLWGIWGLLLGAPLLAIAKVICDRVEALHPVGDLLGG
jgi:predicted PurR-regulated permease PerM